MPTTDLPAARPTAQEPAPTPATQPGRVFVVWVLVIGATLVRAAGFAYPFLSYRLSELALSTNGISTILAAFGVGWLVGQIVLGRLADIVGRRAALVGSMLLAVVTLPLLGGLSHPIAVALAAVVVGAVYDAPRPVITAVVADTVSDDAARASINGWRHFGINVGAATTGAAGGLLSDTTGLTALYWINAVACAAFALTALACMPQDRPTHRGAASVGGRAAYRTAVTDARLWLLWLVSLGALIPVAGLFSILPLLMDDAGLPASAYGWTQVASACTVLVLSVPLNRWLARRASRGASMVPLLAMSSLVLGAGLGSAGLADSTPQYVIAACIGIPGEIVVFVAATALLDQVTPPQARGLYAGIWGSTLAAAVICAPALAGWSLAQGGPQLVAVTTTLCGFIGAAACLPLAVLMRHPCPHQALPVK
ncbi:MFS transporter [Streptomyces sp. NPDC048110]|uniref:MFS transporter n=1 Tax=Streptomyces sp. NPDC048110 TaxID=3155483 RepID=UPI0033ED8E09